MNKVNRDRGKSLNSKAMGAIVATSLLIVVTVVASIGFQGWFIDFESGLTTEVDKQSMNTQLRVDGIFGDTLYLYSGDNSVLSSLKIVDNSGNEMCSFSDANSNLSSLNSDSFLVGWWTLDDEDSIIKDHSGNENHGTLYGTTRLLLDFENNNETHVLDRTGYGNHGELFGGVNCDVDGINGKGCSFDGESGYIDFKNQTSINFTNSFSINLWFKINSINNHNTFIAKSNGGSFMDNGFLVNTDKNGSIRFSISNGTNSYTKNTINNYDDNIWYNLLVVNDNNEKETYIYINGEKVDTYLLLLGNHQEFYPTNIIENNLSLNIGGESDIEYFFNGSIDEVAIYSKALTDVEVKDLYESQKAKFIEFKDSKLGKAVEFDGQNETGIKVENFASKISDYPFSIIAYHKVKDKNAYNSNGWMGIVSIHKKFNLAIRFYSSTPHYAFALSKEIVPFWETLFISNQSLNLKENKMSAVIVNSSHLKYFSNQNIVGIHNVSNTLNPTGEYEYLQIGGIFDYANENFNGQIDEVRIYNRTLTEEEIKDLYWYSIKNNQEGVNQIDISSCNLNKGETYNIVGFTNNQKIEGVSIKR